MKDIDPTLPGDQAVPAAVYLLQRRDGSRFKIGWALDPLVLALLERLRELGAAPLAVRRSGRDAKTVHQPFGARRGARRAKR